MEKKKGPYRVENIVRKGEIACHKQFLLFLLCFSLLYIFGESKCGIVWYWVKRTVYLLMSVPGDKILDLPNLKAVAYENLIVAKVMISLYVSGEKIVGKGDNAGYQHFLLFPQFCQKTSSTGSVKVGIVNSLPLSEIFDL